MANELTITALIKFLKGSVSYYKNLNGMSTISGDAYSAGIQIISTSPEALVFSTDLATVGYLAIRNMGSATVFVIEAVTEDKMIEIKSGEVAIFRPASASQVWMKTDSSSATVEFVAVEA